MVKKNSSAKNKGEWSELYAFLKLMAEGRLFLANEKLEKKEKEFIPIIEIMMDKPVRSYKINGNMIIIESCDRDAISIPMEDFAKASRRILSAIKTFSGRSFEISRVKPFLGKILFDRVKADSGDKRDISMLVHDPRIGIETERGFSIKSFLGGTPTLLNAGKTTNFIYTIKGAFDDDFVREVNKSNTHSKIKERCKRISENGEMKFFQTENSIFESNMTLIDSKLPLIISKMLKSFFLSEATKTKDLTRIISEKNPCKYDMKSGHDYYQYKIKSFLKEVALGMVPSKVWNGRHDATGGYLIVTKMGELLCYQLHNMNDFEDYLFENTKFETASSSRHGFGQLEKVDGEYRFKLNLQIRFV